MVRLLNPPAPRSPTPSLSHSAVLVNDHEKRIEAELTQLQKDIRRVGSNPGEPSVLFGELFEDEDVEQYYEALVGTLKCAKKRSIITFKGQMLLKGMHDNVEISIVDSDEENIASKEYESVARAKTPMSQSLPMQSPPKESPFKTNSLSPSSSRRVSPLPDSHKKKTKDSLARVKPSESIPSPYFNRISPRVVRKSLSSSDSKEKPTDATVADAKPAETQSLTSTKRNPQRLPALNKTPPRGATKSVLNQTIGQQPTENPVAKQSPPSSVNRTPPRVPALDKTPPKGSTKSVHDVCEQPSGSPVASANESTLPSVNRTPPRAHALKRTPPRWGTPSFPSVRQTPPRPPNSCSHTVSQDEMPSIPGVQRITASPKSSTFSPVRHTRNEHSSLKIPNAFTYSCSRKDYTSDSEAEFSSRRDRVPSKGTGASSDTEAEVSSRRDALKDRKLSLPTSFGDSESDEMAEKMLTVRRSATNGSVAERWTKRSPVSKSNVNATSETESPQRRPIEAKSRRASSVNEMSSTRSGAFGIMNREKRITTQSRTDKGSETNKTKRRAKSKSFSGTELAATTSSSREGAGGSGSAKAKGPESSTLSVARAKSEKVLRPSCIRVDEEVEQLLRDICRVGSNPGEPRVTFGELFDDEAVQNTYEALVGTLRSAKRQGLIRFDGQMLFKGMHDNVMIEIVEK